MGKSDGKQLAGKLGEPYRLGLALCRLGESGELGKAHFQTASIKDRWWGCVIEMRVDSISRQDGTIAWLPPVLFLHMVLLPLNIVRLVEIVRATRA